MNFIPSKDKLSNTQIKELENMIFYIFGAKETLEDLGTTQSGEKDLLRNVILSFVISVFMRNRLQQYRESRD